MPVPVSAATPSAVDDISQLESAISLNELDTILNPQFTNDSFEIGGQKFRLRPLPWRWERDFRKQALPMLEAEFKPLENVIFAILTEQHLVKDELGVIKDVMRTEEVADTQLTPAVVIICLSQDEEIAKFTNEGQEVPVGTYEKCRRKYIALIENAEFEESPRDYLRRVVRSQMNKQKMVDKLGESLQARFAEFASLAGMKQDLRSLMLDSMRRAWRSSGRGTIGGSTVDKSAGFSTESSKTTTSPTPTPTPEEAPAEVPSEVAEPSPATA